MQIGRQRAIEELAVAGASQETINALRSINTELAANLEIEERLKAEGEDADTVRELEMELALLTATKEERFKILAIQQLSVEAEKEHIDKVAALLEKIEKAKDAHHVDRQIEAR